MADRPLIAVINDDPAFLEFIASFIEEETAYDTIVWDDGTDAIPKLVSCQPDAVILDIRLGDQPVGKVILQAIRDDRALAHIPVIVCTADSSFLKDHQELLESLDAMTLEKPFDLCDLEKYVSDAVHRRLGPTQDCGATV